MTGLCMRGCPAEGDKIAGLKNFKVLEGDPKCEYEVISLKEKLKEMKSRGTRIESLINKF